MQIGNRTILKRWLITLFGYRFGFERSWIYAEGKLYLERWIIYAGGTLRLHRFLCGDEARAPHDHPWWFITFPLSAYREVVHDPQNLTAVPYVNEVRPWRFHFRSPFYRHRVLPMTKPVWTIVLTGMAGSRGREAIWGFYPKPDEFIPYTQWTEYTNGKSIAAD